MTTDQRRRRYTDEVAMESAALEKTAAPPPEPAPPARPRRLWALMAASFLAGGLVAGSAALLLGPRAAPSVKPSPPAVHIDSEPPGALVEWDGKPADPTPHTTTQLTAGPHRLVLHKQGYQDYSALISVPATGTMVLPPVRLKPEESPPPIDGNFPGVRPAVVRVSSEPEGALVKVGNNTKGLTPIQFEVEPGDDKLPIRLELRGYRPVIQSLVVDGSQPEIRLKVQLERDRRGKTH